MLQHHYALPRSLQRGTRGWLVCSYYSARLWLCVRRRAGISRPVLLCALSRSVVLYLTTTSVLAGGDQRDVYEVSKWSSQTSLADLRATRALGSWLPLPLAGNSCSHVVPLVRLTYLRFVQATQLPLKISQTAAVLEVSLGHDGCPSATFQSVMPCLTCPCNLQIFHSATGLVRSPIFTTGRELLGLASLTSRHKCKMYLPPK